jgi:hypothetical protein
MNDVNGGVGAAGFDFLHGDWNVRHERLSARLTGDGTWERFGGTVSVRPILHGLGNFDENVIDLPSGSYAACTLRLFDDRSGTWSIRWIDGREPDLGPPVIGSFENGVGTFMGADLHEGAPVLVRFQWSRTDSAVPRWEQAFSADEGRSWETNWIMEFDRLAGVEKEI